MTSMDLKAPYNYVQMENVISDVIKLLGLDQSLSGTATTSVVITKEKYGSGNLLNLKGLGKHLWEGIDAQEYVNKLREEWDK